MFVEQKKSVDDHFPSSLHLILSTPTPVNPAWVVWVIGYDVKELKPNFLSETDIPDMSRFPISVTYSHHGLEWRCWPLEFEEMNKDSQAGRLGWTRQIWLTCSYPHFFTWCPQCVACNEAYWVLSTMKLMIETIWYLHSSAQSLCLLSLSDVVTISFIWSRPLLCSHYHHHKCQLYTVYSLPSCGSRKPSQ